MPIYLNYSLTGTAVASLAKGQVHGMTLGSKTVTPRSVWAEVHGWNYGVQAPRDAASGQASGKRQHKPIVITKETDSTSTNLFQHCLAGNQVFPKLEINLLFANPKGHTERFGTIVLTNATLLSFSRGRNLPGGLKHVSSEGPEEFEEIKFEFYEIKYTYGTGGKTTSDDWNTA